MEKKVIKWNRALILNQNGKKNWTPTYRRRIGVQYGAHNTIPQAPGSGENLAWKTFPTIPVATAVLETVRAYRRQSLSYLLQNILGENMFISKEKIWNCYEIPDDVKFLYVVVIRDDVINITDWYLCKILFIACKKAITKNGCKPEPPSFKQWMDIQ